MFGLGKKGIAETGLAPASEAARQASDKFQSEDWSVAVDDKASDVKHESEPVDLSDNVDTQVDNTNQKLTLTHQDSQPSNQQKIEQSVQLIVEKLAPRPATIEQTGLNENLLLDLLLKTLNINGASSVKILSERLALSGGVIKELIELGKRKSLIENTSRNLEGDIRFDVSHLGGAQAEKAMLKSGYLNVAPVPLNQYQKVCRAQSNRADAVTEQEFLNAFNNVVLPQELTDKVGPALNSSKPILIYGLPGTGKSFFCRQLNKIFGDNVLIPHAIEVNNEIIQVFDPEIHQVVEVEKDTDSLLKLDVGHDPRWVLCRRPLVITGGELHLDMLETRFDPNSRTYRAPLQVKANNGILLLDDLGRQKVSPKELFNRWIIPLEERRDFLSLVSGLHFEVPFELMMLFSTNLDPSELIDDAFLRRLGYKIPFAPMDEAQYKKIWDKTCKDSQLNYSPELFQYLSEKLHREHNKAFLPCYPRDLIAIIDDQISYKSLERNISQSLLDFAWESYFVGTSR